MKRMFKFASDAKSFQRKKQKEGYKTRYIPKLGVAFPTHVVEYVKVKK